MCQFLPAILQRNGDLYYNLLTDHHEDLLLALGLPDLSTWDPAFARVEIVPPETEAGYFADPSEWQFLMHTPEASWITEPMMHSAAETLRGVIRALQVKKPCSALIGGTWILDAPVTFLRDARVIAARGSMTAPSSGSRTWRQVNGFGGAFQLIDLRGGFIERSNFAGAFFRDANLRDVRFVETALDNAIFARADLSYAGITRCAANNAAFREAKLEGAHFHDSSSPGASFDYAEMCGFSGTQTDFRRASFIGANLASASFREAILTRSTFANANLQNANFREATLREVCFVGADLTGAAFTGADLTGTDFDDAKGAPKS